MKSHDNNPSRFKSNKAQKALVVGAAIAAAGAFAESTSTDSHSRHATAQPPASKSPFVNTGKGVDGKLYVYRDQEKWVISGSSSESTPAHDQLSDRERAVAGVATLAALDSDTIRHQDQSDLINTASAVQQAVINVADGLNRHDIDVLDTMVSDEVQDALVDRDVYPELVDPNDSSCLNLTMDDDGIYIPLRNQL